MTQIESITPDMGATEKKSIKAIARKSKRPIFCFGGEKPIAINLDHVTSITRTERKVILNFYSSASFVELDDETSAIKVFEFLLNMWADDVVE